MTEAMEAAAAGSRIDADEVVLRSRSWDRLFIVGGVALVPVPILAFYALRGLGLTEGQCEDLVTLLVMVAVGGPHVFATYTRTFLNPTFPRQDRALFVAALAVMVVVMGAAASSAFFDVTIYGVPPIHYVLTFFFFWAGVHIVQQNSYCAAVYGAKAGQTGRPRWWGGLDYALMLLAMYPVSLFRMSMVHPDPAVAGADPAALATRIVLWLGFTPEFADAYVFRIGRVAPVLPDFMRSPVLWIGVTAAFAAAAVLFLWKTARERRSGSPLRLRAQLVGAMAIAGSVTPLFPNLDSAFQGMNAWHSFQYLGLLWLMNRHSYERGEIRYRFFDVLMAPGRHWRFYAAAIGGTLLLLSAVVFTGWLIETGSGGRFVMFGHQEPVVDPATGRALYRPGSVLLAYYMVAFSLLLVHYLHDGAFFLRKRYLLGPAA